MKKSRLYGRLTGLMLLPCAALLFGCGGCSTLSSERAAEAKLQKVIEAHGYTLFTPLRSGDYPGTIFVFAKDARGRGTEFTVSPWNQTFVAQPEDLFKAAGDDVVVGDRITEDTQVTGNFAISLLKPVMDLSGMASNLQSVVVTFGPNQKRHAMSLATLSKFQTRLQPETKAALARLKKNKQLQNAYIVMETLTVDNLRVSLEVKTGCEGNVSAQKLEKVADAKISVVSAKVRDYALNVATPIMVGYKALRVPDTILSELVSPPTIAGRVLTPQEVAQIKGR